jgi:hypothetical protein
MYSRCLYKYLSSTVTFKDLMMMMAHKNVDDLFSCSVKSLNDKTIYSGIKLTLSFLSGR